MRTLKPFEYHEPKTVTEALQVLSEYGEKTRVLAGGIDLLPRMRKGKIEADCLVNIQKISELEYFRRNDRGDFEFGATTKLYFLENSDAVRKNYPILYKAIHQIASVQAKHMGTVVGNLCVGTPASDIATVLFALGAELKIAGMQGIRNEALESFYPAYGQTSLNPGEMVTGVILPASQMKTKSSFLNLLRTRADIAKISVAVALVIENDRCRKARIAMGAVAPTVIRAKKAEELLKEKYLDNKVIQNVSLLAAEETKPINDVRSTADYRKEMTKLLISRALWQALEN